MQNLRNPVPRAPTRRRAARTATRVTTCTQLEEVATPSWNSCAGAGRHRQSAGSLQLRAVGASVQAIATAAAMLRDSVRSLARKAALRSCAQPQPLARLRSSDRHRRNVRIRLGEQEAVQPFPRAAFVVPTAREMVTPGHGALGGLPHYTKVAAVGRRAGTLQHTSKRASTVRTTTNGGESPTSGAASPPSPTSSYRGLAPRYRWNHRNALAPRGGVSRSRGNEMATRI